MGRRDAHHRQPPASDHRDARRGRVVLTVGTRKVTVGELEDQIAVIPVYQLSQFGSTKASVARAYLDQVLTRDLVLAAGAEQRGLDKQLPTKQVVDRALEKLSEGEAGLERTRLLGSSAAAGLRSWSEEPASTCEPRWERSACRPRLPSAFERGPRATSRPSVSAPPTSSCGSETPRPPTGP